ncbi:MAG: hypothetical protein ACRD3E_18310 [Terriglobales bacterium]
MPGQNEGIGVALLSRLPQPANHEAYQEEVKSLLAANEKKLRQNKWTVRRVWIFVIVSSIPSLYMAGAHFNTPQANWFLGSVFFWVLFGAIEIAKYHNNQSRVELLKEIKQVQLQVLELNAVVAKAVVAD